MSTASYAYQRPTPDWEEEPVAEADYMMAFTADELMEPVARLIGTEDMPGWFPAMVNELNEVMGLPDGWAGPNSKAPNTAAALKALKIVSGLSSPSLVAPQLVPTVDGGIQFEWHTRGIDLELTVLPWGAPDAYVHDHQRGEEWAGSLDEVFEDVRLALKALMY